MTTNTNEVSELEDRLSNMDTSELLASMAVAIKLKDRLAEYEKTCRRILDNMDHEDMDIYVAGVPVGSISWTNGSAPRYEVVDEARYVKCLETTDGGITLEDGSPAVETVTRPTKEAMGSSFIKKLAARHGGAIPWGCQMKPGRAATMRTTINPAWKRMPLQAETINKAFDLIEGAE